VPIEQVEANPDQPRKQFEKGDLDDLAASIKEKGVIQPLIVRVLDNGRFQIVAGERRWRAAQMAKLHELPVVIRQF
jgi:ParB family chromosome partitioning protein